MITAHSIYEEGGYIISFCLFFSDSIDSAIERYGLQKVSILRGFCKMAGIQILLREFALDSKSKQPFYEEDILNVFPIVKHIHPKVFFIFIAFKIKY